MRIPLLTRLCWLFLTVGVNSVPAAEEYPPHPDSITQAGVAKGELIKGSYVANEDSVFPGTTRNYQIYLPAAYDRSNPAPFMVFQDGVIYNAPVVFDNLIAKHEVPPLIGVFIDPGVVPAANPGALPRYNRSYEYDSVSDKYSKFLINEFLPAIAERHGLNFSTNPNDAAICGNSSGGICAFMTAWHRPDRFRRVFTGVGTYIGIQGADQMPVLVRKTEPKPLRVYLQSGEQDNNLYCGDWWMANQTMERALGWAGYDVAHTWGSGGHNGKQATAIFPDVLRWLWKGWPAAKELKPNPRGDSKWLGYQVLDTGSGWESIDARFPQAHHLASDIAGNVYVIPHGGERDTMPDATRKILKLPPAPPINADWVRMTKPASGTFEMGSAQITRIGVDGSFDSYAASGTISGDGAVGPDGHLVFARTNKNGFLSEFISKTAPHGPSDMEEVSPVSGIAIDHGGRIMAIANFKFHVWSADGASIAVSEKKGETAALALSPDQTLVYTCQPRSDYVSCFQIGPDGKALHQQDFAKLQVSPEGDSLATGLCVDKEGRLYVATDLGVQVCDQAGRVNFIISTPFRPLDVCFGGKDLGELFIKCIDDRVYKRRTKTHGIVSGQMPPTKPAAPKL